MTFFFFFKFGSSHLVFNRIPCYFKQEEEKERGHETEYRTSGLLAKLDTMQI